MPRDFTDQAKFDYRERCIIEPFRRLTGLRAIPKKGQVISLTGPLSDNRGSILQSSELDHMLGKEVMAPHQLHSIESDIGTHKLNERMFQRVFPVSNRPTSHLGKWIPTFETLAHNPTFCPIIVHLDLQVGPKEGIVLLGRTLEITNAVEPKTFTMVTYNTIIKSSYNSKSFDGSFEDALEDERFRSAYIYGWRIDEKVRKQDYRSNHTVMRTLVLYRRS